MKILHLEKKRRLSGQALRTFRVIKGLKKRGHEVGLACRPDSALGDKVEQMGVSVVRLPMIGMKLFASVPRLRRFIRSSAFQIIHSHGARDHLLGALARLGMRGVSLVRTKHNMEPLRSGAFSRLLYRRFTDRLVAVSGTVRDVLVKDGVPADYIDVVYTGIDVRRFAPRPKDPQAMARLGLTDKHVVIGLTARLASESVDALTLLHAFHRLAQSHPDLRLLLVGRGNKRLASQARALGIADRVFLPGFTDDVPAMLSLMDVYVQPNVKAALGTAIAEAMAMAKPVVATRVGGHVELVVDGETGRLCVAGDPGAMAETIGSLIGRRDELTAMGRRGRERAEEFDQERMVEQIEGVYERLTPA